MIVAIHSYEHAAKPPIAERIDRKLLIRVREIDGPMVYVARADFANARVSWLPLYNKDGSRVGGKVSRIHRASLDPAGTQGADLNRHHARPNKVSKAFARSHHIHRQIALLRIAQEDVANIAGCAVRGFNSLSRML